MGGPLVISSSSVVAVSNPSATQGMESKMELKSDTAKIQFFVDNGNFHAAVNIAISALNECRRNNDQEGVDNFLGVIKGVVASMEKAFGSR